MTVPKKQNATSKKDVTSTSGVHIILHCRYILHILDMHTAKLCLWYLLQSYSELMCLLIHVYQDSIELHVWQLNSKYIVCTCTLVNCQSRTALNCM